MRSRLLAAAALSVLATAVAACSNSATGTPTAQGAGSETSASPEPAPITTEQPGQPTVAIPPRPKALPLDGIKPCTLFPDKVQQQLKVTRARSRVSDDLYKAPQCVLDATANGADISYAATAITTEGISAWLDGKRVVTAKLVSVAGYPAVSYYPEGSGPATGVSGCYTSVDVADGQQLMIDLQPFDVGKLSQNEECQMTEQAASLAVATLQTQR